VAPHPLQLFNSLPAVAVLSHRLHGRKRPAAQFACGSPGQPRSSIPQASAARQQPRQRPPP
jgi:hypothetical protein